MTQLAVRLPDSLLKDIDGLVAAGRFRTRTAAVRVALDRLVAAEREAEIDRRLAEGYARSPAEEPDALVRALAERSIEQEPW